MEDGDVMVKHCIACPSRIYLREPLYIHDALQLRWAVIGVEDARIPTACGNEHVLVDAAKQGWNGICKDGSKDGMEEME